MAAPQLVADAAEVAELLDLQPASCTGEEFAQAFVGNRLLPGMDPYACCYGGHQFGNWAGQLGDGRAILIGEVIDQAGKLRDIQLKGSGPTPFSRNVAASADARASAAKAGVTPAGLALRVAAMRAG